MKKIVAIAFFCLIPHFAMASPFTPPPADVMKVKHVHRVHKKPVVHHVHRHYRGASLRSKIDWGRVSVRPGALSIVYRHGGPTGTHSLRQWFAKNPPRQRRIWHGSKRALFGWNLAQDAYRVCSWRNQGMAGLTVPWKSDTNHALCGVQMTGYFHVSRGSTLLRVVSHQDEAVASFAVDDHTVIHGGRGVFDTKHDVAAKQLTNKKGEIYLAPGWHRAVYRIFVLAMPRPGFPEGRGSAYLTLAGRHDHVSTVFLPVASLRKKPTNDSELLHAYDLARSKKIHLEPTGWDLTQASFGDVDGFFAMTGKGGVK